MSRSIRYAPLAAIAVAALLMAGCAPDSSSTPSSPDAATGGTLTIGAQIDNNSFDTAELQTGNTVQFWQPVYDTLLTLTPDAEIEPNMATSWEYNDDNTVLTLELRDDITFIDGTPFDGDAVKANIEHLKAGTGQNQVMAASISEVVVNSPTEVELHLSAPNPAQLNYLGTVGGAMASPSAIEGGDLATNPVGSGPYTYDAAASTIGTSYSYTRNEDYWNKEAYPYDTVIVKPMSDMTPRVNALKSGQINGALVSPQVADEVAAAGLTLAKLPVNWSGIVIADRAGTMVPALADKRVRQAINMAFDRDAIVASSVYAGYGSPTQQVFNAKSQAFVSSLDETYAYDPEKAKELLADAGYPDGFTVTMPLIPGSEARMALYTQQLADIGITVETELVPGNSAIKDVLSGKWPMFVFNLASASAWQDLQAFVTPDAPWNMFHSEDPALNDLITEAQYATDAATQDAAFQKINTWLVDEAWFAPVLTPDNIFATTAGTTTQMQAQNSVPSLSAFAPGD